MEARPPAPRKHPPRSKPWSDRRLPSTPGVQACCPPIAKQGRGLPHGARWVGRVKCPSRHPLPPPLRPCLTLTHRYPSALQRAHRQPTRTSPPRRPPRHCHLDQGLGKNKTPPPGRYRCEQHVPLGLLDTLQTMFMWQESPSERVDKNRALGIDPPPLPRLPSETEKAWE